MGKRIGVVFTTLTDAQWKAFKLACVSHGLPMTKVLWDGGNKLLQEMAEKDWQKTWEKKEKEGRGVRKLSGDAIYVDPLDWAKEGGEDNGLR